MSPVGAEIPRLRLRIGRSGELHSLTVNAPWSCRTCLRCA